MGEKSVNHIVDRTELLRIQLLQPFRQMYPFIPVILFKAVLQQMIRGYAQAIAESDEQGKAWCSPTAFNMPYVRWVYTACF